MTPALALLLGLTALVLGLLLAGAAAMFENYVDVSPTARPTLPALIGLLAGLVLAFAGTLTMLVSFGLMIKYAVF